MSDSPENEMKKDLVFIASGGRTGTTFFGERLARAIKDCWSEHEPDTFSSKREKTWSRINRFGIWHMVLGRLLGVTGLRAVGHRYLTGQWSKEKCCEALKRCREKYHSEIGEPLIIESSGRWWMFADVLNEVWPRAKLIGIIRDPRDWVPSWQRHQPRRHTAQFFSWFPLGPLTPRGVGDADWADRWDELDQFGRLAWDWRMQYGRLHGAAHENPRVKIFRFEDLFYDDGSTVRELIAFAADHGDRKYVLHDLRGFTDKVANASKGKRDDWRDWPPERAKLLDEMCGPLMRDYGYGLEPEWRALVNGAESVGDRRISQKVAVA